MNTARRIRTLIVDDSALARKIITESLSHDPSIEVVGGAVDPYVARDKILTHNPDVLTLDIEMPRMDGLSFLKLLMKHRPMPVIVMSSLTSEGSAKAVEALEAGAVDVIGKPNGSFSAYEDGARLAAKIKAAAAAKLTTASDRVQTPAASIQKKALTPATASTCPERRIILIGASTGGTEAIKKVLTTLPPDLPGICIVQHIPAHFSLSFANRLNELCALEVREARSGDILQPGLALIAPGGHHLLLRWTGTRYLVQLSGGPAVHHQRPAVDVMFDSAVKAGVGADALSILLTGMGSDGATGLLNLRHAGASTVAQDEASSVVWGMPREAIKLGAAQEVLPLNHISQRIIQWAKCPVDASKP
jgi:two-component system chemotaxis response regulator CheB